MGSALVRSREVKSGGGEMMPLISTTVISILADDQLLLFENVNLYWSHSALCSLHSWSLWFSPCSHV